MAAKKEEWVLLELMASMVNGGKTVAMEFLMGASVMRF